MSVSIIEEIKINLVNYLIRWKKQIASALAVLTVLLLLIIIQRATLNNSAWLQGNWTNQSVDYSFKAKNKGFTKWAIKRKGLFVLKHAWVTVNSNKKRIILTDDGNTVEYQVTKLDRNHLKLEIMKNGKSKNSLKLQKE